MKIIILSIIGIMLINLSLFSQDFDFAEPKVNIGGYGELHYNKQKLGNQETKTMLDFHRFVLFFGYNWNEKWSLKSEIELEHNYVYSGQGELELEQAYVNYHYADYFGFQAGVILPSIGLINENHEPPLFFGVERPDYHNRIIPTTWFGSGAAVYGEYYGISYKVTILEGLNSDMFSASSGIRGGRQKGYKPEADALLYNVRINFLNIEGLRFGASYTYNDAKGDSTNIPVSITEFHAKYEANNIYSVFEIGNIGYKNSNIQTSFGYYFDLGYDVASLVNWDVDLIPFIRYSDTNTASSVNDNLNDNELYHFKEFMVGLSFKPISQIVFKVDYSQRIREFDKQITYLFNLGLGYMF